MIISYIIIIILDWEYLSFSAISSIYWNSIIVFQNNHYNIPKHILYGNHTFFFFSRIFCKTWKTGNRNWKIFLKMQKCCNRKRVQLKTRKALKKKVRWFCWDFVNFEVMHEERWHLFLKNKKPVGTNSLGQLFWSCLLSNIYSKWFNNLFRDYLLLLLIEQNMTHHCDPFTFKGLKL